MSDQLAVQGSGLSVAVRVPASGRWRHSQESGSNVHWVWGHAADVLVHGSLHTRLPFGNPVIGMRFVDTTDATTDSGEPKGVVRGAPVELTGIPAATAELTLVSCFRSARSRHTRRPPRPRRSARRRRPDPGDALLAGLRHRARRVGAAAADPGAGRQSRDRPQHPHRWRTWPGHPHPRASRRRTGRAGHQPGRVGGDTHAQRQRRRRGRGGGRRSNVPRRSGACHGIFEPDNRRLDRGLAGGATGRDP